MKRTFWQKPSINFEEKLRSTSWLELFFDLFFVVAIASISHEFTDHLSLKGLMVFVGSFIPIWWIWIGFTFYNERFETDGMENRLFTFMVMLPVAGFAFFAQDAYGQNYKGFVSAYIIGRLIITLLWARAGYYSVEFRQTSKRFVLGFSFALIIATISLFCEGTLRFILLGLGLLIDLATPWFTINLQKKLPALSRSRLPERFGLFTIIVLGEMIVGVIGGLSKVSHFSLDYAAIGVLGIAITFGFWWIYFDFIARRPFHNNMWVSITWSYLHLPLLISFVAVGVGLLNIVTESGNLSATSKITLSGAVGFGLIFLGLVEFTLERTKDEPTHKYWSPALKLLCGIISLFIGWYAISCVTTQLMLILLISELVVIGYGIYVWFEQDI